MTSIAVIGNGKIVLSYTSRKGCGVSGNNITTTVTLMCPSTVYFMQMILF